MVNCSLEDTELILLVALMEKLQNLYELDLSQNRFNKNLSQLMNSIAQNCSLIK